MNKHDLDHMRAFLEKATARHRGREIHVVLDNLSTHTTTDVKAWPARNPHVTLRSTPVGSSWLNQARTWFGLITKQSIRHRTLEHPSRALRVDHVAYEILTKLRLVQTNIKKLVDNNGK
jgi:hypothetical protein